MEKLVSIIIPVYNAEKYIKKCIESIINQTYKNIEIIVVDDGSKDNSLNIIKKYKNDSRVKIISTQNHGVSFARNLGLKKCAGDFVMFVDSDDWIESNAVEVLLNAAVEQNAEIVQSSYYQDEDGHIELKQRKIKQDGIKELKEKIFLINTMNDINFGALRCVWGKIFKKEIIQNTRFDENIYLLEDGIFIYECMENIECFQFINQHLYHYRKVETSACNRFNEDQLAQYKNISNKLLRILTKDQIQLYYKVMLECIMTYISRLANYSKIGKNEKIKLIENLVKDNQYEEAIKHIDLNILNKKEKITIFLLKNNMLQMLYLICKIKDLIKGRK